MRVEKKERMKLENKENSNKQFFIASFSMWVQIYCRRIANSDI